MWGGAPASPYYVVECKGCQTTRPAVMNQIRRGLEQVPSVVFGSGARRIITLVIGTHMPTSQTTVYVVDPPGPPDDDEPGRPHRGSESGREKEWRISERMAGSGQQVKLLNWAGQFTTASRLFQGFEKQLTAPTSGLMLN
jgi:hypothetical protein